MRQVVPPSTLETLRRELTETSLLWFDRGLLSWPFFLSVTLRRLVFGWWSCDTNSRYLAMMTLSTGKARLSLSFFGLLLGLASFSLTTLLLFVERLGRFIICLLMESPFTSVFDGKTWFSAMNCVFKLWSFFKLFCNALRRFSAMFRLNVAWKEQQLDRRNELKS